ncbi:hypothetical protein, partial [uncultured Desulfovibrio sp.]|uniref:hypothetical protein n=1 Tax=uncultured Desulfovibrio sp. TaxID=167968 RepID=UPI00262A76D1
AKISVGRKSESQSSFPFALHLSMNHRRITRREVVIYAASFSLSTTFFRFRKKTLPPPRATR